MLLGLFIQNSISKTEEKAYISNVNIHPSSVKANRTITKIEGYGPKVYMKYVTPISLMICIAVEEYKNSHQIFNTYALYEMLIVQPKTSAFAGPEPK